MSTETTKVAPMFNVVAINDVTGNKIVLTGYPEKHHEACVILSKTMPILTGFNKEDLSKIQKIPRILGRTE